MMFTNVKYNDTHTVIHCEFSGKNLSVPINPTNRHYIEIMRQVEAGELVIAEPD